MHLTHSVLLDQQSPMQGAGEIEGPADHHCASQSAGRGKKSFTVPAPPDLQGSNIKSIEVKFWPYLRAF